MTTIRPARESDGTALAAIYNVHVLNGTATFDIEPKTAEFMGAKIGECLSCGWPFLVAEKGNTIVGYAYATQFRDRPAYAMTCEDSIYILHEQRGIGTPLLAALIEAAAQHGFRQMIAVAGGGEPASIRLHEKLGFVVAGRIKSVGRKHGKWLDTVYLQRALGHGDQIPPEKEHQIS